MITKTLDLNNIERKIFWVLASLVCLTIGFYLYSALALTVAGVDRDRLSRRVHALATDAGDLEAEYLAQSNSVTLARAQELGFREVNAKFADLGKSAQGDTAKLSLAR